MVSRKTNSESCFSRQGETFQNEREVNWADAVVDAVMGCLGRSHLGAKTILTSCRESLPKMTSSYWSSLGIASPAENCLLLGLISFQG